MESQDGREYFHRCAIARESRTDAHADGSTFVPRKATISGFATNPTRTFLANARKADRNHGFMFCFRSVPIRSCAQFSFYDRQNSHFMTDKFHFMTEPTSRDRSRFAPVILSLVLAREYGSQGGDKVRSSTGGSWSSGASSTLRLNI